MLRKREWVVRIESNFNLLMETVKKKLAASNPIWWGFFLIKGSTNYKNGEFQQFHLNYTQRTRRTEMIVSINVTSQ